MYIPLLTDTLLSKCDENADQQAMVPKDDQDSGRAEFLSQTRKFSTQLSNAILQVSVYFCVGTPDHATVNPAGVW